MAFEFQGSPESGDIRSAHREANYLTRLKKTILPRSAPLNKLLTSCRVHITTSRTATRSISWWRCYFIKSKKAPWPPSNCCVVKQACCANPCSWIFHQSQWIWMWENIYLFLINYFNLSWSTYDSAAVLTQPQNTFQYKLLVKGDGQFFIFLSLLLLQRCVLSCGQVFWPRYLSYQPWPGCKNHSH